MTQQPAISIDVSQRGERPPRRFERSPWSPLLVVVLWLEVTGLAFGPAILAQAHDWTWIIYWYMGIYSIVPAQFCVLHLALIFAPEPFRCRLIAYWLICLVTLAGWYGWLWTVSPGSQLTGISPGDFIEMGFWLPPFLLALQLPLWIVRWVTGWRLVNQRRSRTLDAPGMAFRFSIRELVAFTALIAVTLAAGRGLWSWDPPSAGEGFMRGLIPMFGRTLGIAVALVPPTIAWLRREVFFLPWAWLVTLIYTAAVVCLGCVLHYWTIDSYLEGYSVISTMTAAFSVPYIAALHLLRGHGWRLSSRS